MTRTLRPIRSATGHRRVLRVAEVLVVLGTLIALVAVNRVDATTLTLFLVGAQPLLLLGVLIYGAVAAAELLARRGVSRLRFEDGDVIFRQGETGDRMYTIIDGEVELVRAQDGGEPETVAVLRAGDYFGEMALVADEPRNATARARGRVDVAAMARADFTALYAYVPDFQRLVENLVRTRAGAR